MDTDEGQLLMGGLGLILLGIGLVVALRLLVAAQRPARRDDVLTLLMIGGLTWMAMGAIAVFMGILWGLGGLGIVVGLVILLGVCVPIAGAGLGGPVVQSRQRTLLWTLAVAAERKMPLNAAIEAFAAESRGMLGWRARQLLEFLKAGRSLPEALERSPRLVSKDALLMIRVGHEAGDLSAALREAAGPRTTRDPVWGQASTRLAYIFGVLTYAMLAVVFLDWKILPMFARIFAEFGATLPPMTSATTAAINMLAPFATIFAVFCVVLFGWSMSLGSGDIPWSLPGLRWRLRRLDAAVILEALALVTRQERPLVLGIAALARAYPRWSVRRRLRSVLRDMQSGADSLESLASRRLVGRADLAVLQAAQRAGNLAWAFHEMADSNRRRLAYRMQVVLQFLFPLVILILGGLMLVFMVAYFLPLVTLIQILA